MTAPPILFLSFLSSSCFRNKNCKAGGEIITAPPIMTALPIPFLSSCFRNKNYKAGGEIMSPPPIMTVPAIMTALPII